MSKSRQQWLLKVVAGPHQGAEVALHPGKTLVGSDDECDVVLHDVLIAPQHLELELGQEGVFAAPLGGRIFVGGKRVREARQTVPDFTFLSLGGTHLVIGPAKGSWPLLSAADSPELEKEVDVPEVQGEAEEEAASLEASEETAPTVEAPTIVTPVAAPRSRAWFGIAAGILLLGGWAAVYQKIQATTDRADSPVVVEEKRDPLERAKAIVEQLGLSGGIRVEESAGRLSASGYVDTEAKQRELQTSFREELPGLRSKIYSLEKITSSARSLIDAQRLPLTVTSLAEGKLKVTGKLDSADPWEQMRATLMREVPGINGIEDGVEIATPTLATPTVVAPRPIVVLPSAEPAVPLPAKVEVKEAPEPVEKWDVFVTPDSIDRADAVIATIRADRPETAYMRLSTGGVYFVGARLPYGGILTKIEPDRITVQEGDVTRNHSLGQTVTRSQSTASNSKP
jgi:type III secretion system YscD/HrpQ family protein